MHLLWIIGMAASFTVANCETFNLTALAVNSLKPFCGNDTAIETLKRCSAKYISFQDGLFKCANTDDYIEVVEKSCKAIEQAAQCTLEEIPHTSEDDIITVQDWHKCIGVELSMKTINDFNKQLADSMNPNL